METLIAPEEIINQTGISKMSLEQRIKIMEAIEKTVIEEIEAMGFPPDDEEDEGEYDITLAEEALAKYKSDPSSARTWDEVYKELKSEDFEIDDAERFILKQRLDEYKSNPLSAINWKDAKAQIKREMNG